MKLAILGAGESGVGTAILAQKQGYDVFVSDFGTIAEKYKNMLDAHGLQWEEGGHTAEKILDADEVVKSPGIPDTAPIVAALNAQGTPILAEIEFASRFTKGRTICITGSNGKTTTTSLIYYIMSEAGMNVGLGGNIGKSFALQVAEEDKDWYVVELSSFQLDNMFDFRADIAVLMNVTSDHLDRYEYELQHYVDSKMRIIQNQTPDDTFVYWKEDDNIEKELPKNVQGGVTAPTPTSKTSKPAHPTLKPFSESDFERYNLSFSQPGQHNKRNALAAYFATLAAGVPEDVVRQALKTFKGVEHRLEFVADIDGVRYVNDSKATNVDACKVALEAMTTPTVLIVGGKDKGNDYSVLDELILEKCRALVYLGADNAKLHAAFDALGLPVADTHSMKDCVAMCRKLAQKGDTVLLSPCCASFDLFKNMEDRGEQFITQVKQQS